MKKAVIVLIMTFLALGANNVDAKTGYVDMKRVLDESLEGKEAIGKLKEMVQEKQQIITEKSNKIKELEEELAKQASVLNAETKKAKQDEHDKLMRDTQRMIKDSEDDLQKKQNEFMKAIFNKVEKIIKKVGKEEGYTAIHDKMGSGTIFVNDKADITDYIIKKLDESLKAGEK